jgi:RNA polymerase sigma factor (sigma-70 family)
MIRPVSRPSTVVTNVVTDPNQLVKAMIERQSLKDREALEDLYKMSGDGTDGRLNVAPRPKRVSTSRAGESSTPVMGTPQTRMNGSTEDWVSGATRKSSLNSLPSSTNPRRQPAKTLAMMARDEELLLQQGKLQPRPGSARPRPARFNALTRGGNKRNTRRKSLSSVSPVDRNPTLLRDRIEERRMAAWTDDARSYGLTPEDDGDTEDGPGTPIDAEAADADSDDIAPGIFTPTAAVAASSSGKTSTMPGFMERTQSSRQLAYRDGIRLAEQRMGESLVETRESRKRRRKRNGDLMYKTSASVPESLMQFAGEIHTVDRITPKEELQLGRKTQEAIKIQKVYDGLVERLQREPTDEEWCAACGKINMEAIVQTIEEGLEAKNKLVTANLRMVQGVVNVYIRNGLRGQYNAGDLMQEGIMVSEASETPGKCDGIVGCQKSYSLTFLLDSCFPTFVQALIRAAEKFDPSRGFRFSTYAMYWIRSAIKRDQIHQSRVIQVPQRLQENYKRIVRIRKELTYAMDRPPSMIELSDAVGMSKDHVERCITAMQQKTYSLDQAIVNHKKPFQDSQNSDTLYSVVESKSDDRTDAENWEYIHLREDLIKALRQHLPEEEATLLLLRYGLIDDEEPQLKNGFRTIAEVSRKAGLKPDKVRRTLNRSLSHLQVVIGDEWREYERELPQ